MKKPVIIIQGPTAVGKSSLALSLARTFDLEIISADSRQVYKYMDIATAKASKAELSMVKHHLIDIITPDESYNAGRFARDASQLVDKELSKTPIICGGTGFYINSFLEGLCKIPEIPKQVRKDLIQEWDRLGSAHSYQQLLKIDPYQASKISPNDKQRVLRGLEVYFGTGKKLSSYWEEQGMMQSRKVLNILLLDERDSIYHRINNRYDKMMSLGLLNEIKDLMDRGYSETDPGLSAVGYKELLPYLLSNQDLFDCIELAKQHSRNYAKRQMTWYKRNNFDLVFFQKSISNSNISYYIETFLDNYGVN